MALDTLSRRLADIDEPAVKSLETAEVLESLQLEYKRQLDLNTQAEQMLTARIGWIG